MAGASSCRLLSLRGGRLPGLASASEPGLCSGNCGGCRRRRGAGEQGRSGGGAGEDAGLPGGAAGPGACRRVSVPRCRWPLRQGRRERAAPRRSPSAGPAASPAAPVIRSPRPGPPHAALTLERRRRRIEELSRSSRQRLLQSRDRMFSKFTSILQHAVEAVRPPAAHTTQIRGSFGA